MFCKQVTKLVNKSCVNVWRGTMYTSVRMKDH